MAETDPLLSHGKRDSGIFEVSVSDPLPDTATRNDIKQEYVVCKGRWFILSVFTLLSCFHAAEWNTWGPIADTAKAVLHWTDGDLALLANWGPIIFILIGFVVSYLLLVKGLRFCFLGSSLTLLLGLSIRCLPVGIDNLKWTMNIGHIAIALSGPIMMSGPTVVSAIWFPPHQRTTSTAIAATGEYLGFSLSFLIGPLVVSTIPRNSSSAEVLDLDPQMESRYFGEIMRLMYIECGATAIVVLAALLYFPERPSISPSTTACKPRESFKAGAIKMFKSVHFWIPAISYSVTTGVYSAWCTQLDTIFTHTLQVGQGTIGWIGFISNVAATIGSLIVARFVDFMGGHMKAVLLVFLVGSCLSGLWCVLLIMKIISYNLVSLYMACISMGVCISAPVPLYFEMTVEGMYPVAEGNITMVMTLMNNAATLIFLVLPMIPNIGVMWMTWSLLGSVIICIPILMMYKEQYNRLDIDTATQNTEH